jgi:hypothetical protein
MSEKKPTPEELWERAGYLQAAADASAALDPYDVALDAYDLARYAYDVALAALGAPDASDCPTFADYARGRARWLAEHSEARA